ncbi:hypothetical protein EN784_01145 [bacterium M00.F.Ca.ET.141.01.1.1]|nr:hypothetical protein EN784_01145 [bacterium M00.F.Ca.ET.141.01.1.1]
MAILFFNSDVLLSVAEVQKRVKDRQEWLAQIAVLQKKVAETEEWLNLVAKLIGRARANQLIGDVLLPAQVSTSNEAVLPTERHPRRSPMGDEVKRFLKTQMKGATSRQIIDHLLQTQEFQKGVQRNRGTVYNVLVRLVESRELRKNEKTKTYYSPGAPPNENNGAGQETAVLSESSEARLSSPAAHDTESKNTEEGKNRDASGEGPLISTDYVGRDPAAIPAEVPGTKSTPTKSLFQTDSAAVPPEVPPAQSPPTRSLFRRDPAEVLPEVPPAESLDPDAPAEAPPKNTTQNIFAGISAGSSSPAAGSRRRD